MEWIEITEKNIPEGEVLLFNEKWINEDWNPKGIRIGFHDDVSGWVSACWCNYHDEYHTRYSDEDNDRFEDYKAQNQIPTHYMVIKPFYTKKS